jgi:hypothetical protein
VTGLVVLLLLFAAFGVHGVLSERADAAPGTGRPPASDRRVRLRRLVEQLRRGDRRTRGSR